MNLLEDIIIQALYKFDVSIMMLLQKKDLV